MPYPNFHSCSLPGDFQEGTTKTIERGGLIILIARPRGKETMAARSYRYPKETWSEARAREHCKRNGGRFEAAKKP